MNTKNIARALRAKIDDWCASIDDEKIVSIIKENAIITGGALVSLVNSEQPNDYDVYFRNYESCLAVAKFYAGKWSEKNSYVKIIDDTEASDHDSVQARLKEHNEFHIYVDFDESQRRLKNKRISCFIKSEGVTGVQDKSLADETEPCTPDPKCVKKADAPKYRPIFFTTNAISLSDKIQLVIRFYGSVETIHENYDFVHCCGSYDYKSHAVNFSSETLVAIINKELRYKGSLYPLCSIMRIRKFINRGWSINAGQILKACLQLQKYDLYDPFVLKDQLCGVDSLHFSNAIGRIDENMALNKDFKIDETYLFEIINEIF